MNPRVQLRATKDQALWDRLVAASPAASGYHDWRWLDLQERVLGGVFTRLVVSSGDDPVGVFPVPRAAPPSPRRLSVPFPFLGPLVPDVLLEPTLRAWQRRQLLTGPVVTRFELGPRSSPAARAPLRAAGCSVRELGTIVVDLSHGSIETLNAGFSSMRRRSLRKAARNGVSARRARPGELTPLLGEALDEAYGAHQEPNPYPAHTGRLVDEWAEGRDGFAAFLGLVDEEPAGVVTALAQHDTALFWVGATRRRFQRSGVNDLLYESMLGWAIEQGCKRMDLCGSVDDGIRRYKTSFGGVEQPYLVAEMSVLPERMLRAGRRAVGRAGRR